jgi:hypothetical protein
MPKEEDRLKPGFMGYVKVDNNVIRCSALNGKINQDVLSYDTIYGLLDDKTKKKGVTEGEKRIHPQKPFWRGGTRIAEFSFSFPCTESDYDVVWNLAKEASTFDLSMTFDCETSYSFDSPKIGSLSISATAGDIVQMSVSGIAYNMIETTGLSFTGSSFSEEQLTEKILTWDACSVSLDAYDEPIESLSLNLKNDLKPIFTNANNSSSDDPLTMFDLRVGLQQIDGSISYFKENSIGFIDHTSEKKVLSVSIYEEEYKLNVIDRPLDYQGRILPYLVSVPFVAVEEYHDDD